MDNWHTFISKHNLFSTCFGNPLGESSKKMHPIANPTCVHLLGSLFPQALGRLGAGLIGLMTFFTIYARMPVVH